jgi:predicted nucleic acid-binding protein
VICYFDSSALVKKYTVEVGSERVAEIWESGDLPTMSAIGYAEILAAFGRRLRDGALSRDAFREVVRTFRDDWRHIDVLGVSGGLNEAIDRIVQRHPLRGLDAIHLASDLHVREESSEQVLFVCGDRRLLAAARAEGLTVVPEKDWRTRPRGRP